MNSCPCCAGTLLRHVRHNSVYWFCPHCWQEMPDLESESKTCYPALVSLTKLISQRPAKGLIVK